MPGFSAAAGHGFDLGITREAGLTHVIDKGLGPIQVEDLIASLSRSRDENEIGRAHV